MAFSYKRPVCCLFFELKAQREATASCYCRDFFPLQDVSVLGVHMSCHLCSVFSKSYFLHSPGSNSLFKWQTLQPPQLFSRYCYHQHSDFSRGFAASKYICIFVSCRNKVFLVYSLINCSISLIELESKHVERLVLNHSQVSDAVNATLHN